MDATPSRPFAPPSGAKRHHRGTHRAMAPEETLERVLPLLPQFGITRVADVTGLDRIGIPVALACRPNARSLSVSQGKGLTRAAARVSAIMESIELHHAERPQVPLLLASSAELQASGQPHVPVESLPGARSSRHHAARPLLWAQARALADERTCWVPYEAVHTSALLPAPTGSGALSSTSNGLASGNHRLEALAHALCEVIERDAAAVWQAQPAALRAATRLDLPRVSDPDCQALIDRFHAAGIDVRAWETTSDIGVPAYLCEIVDRQDGVFGSGFTGMGCHLAPPVALLRALTEAAQSRMTYITGSRDDLFRREYRAVRLDARPAGPDTVTGAGRRTLEDAPAEPATGSFQEDVDLLQARLAAAGLARILWVDLSVERIGLPVVRVIVPGLEGPDDEPGYVPGRRAREARAAGEPA